MKSLEQVIYVVQHELDCSISELSRKLGKSRNYLFTHMKNRPSEEKEQEIINLLLELVDDENTMLRNVVVEQEETITAYREKLREVINEKLSVIEEKNNTIPHLHERLINTSRKLNERTESQNATIVELNNTITTKDLFIDGQDEELKGLRERVNILVDKNNSQQESIKALCSDIKHSEELVEIGSNQIERQNKEINDYKYLCNRQRKTLKETREDISRMESKHKTKNRILTGALIGIGLLWAVSVWVMS